MSKLIVTLNTDGGQFNILIDAENVIETSLVIFPDHANLPTLISVERVIEKINDSGFELLNFDETSKIASLMTSYYLPNLKGTWTDQLLTIKGNTLSLNKQQYQEVQKVRQSVIDNTVKIMKDHNNVAVIKQNQDNIAINIIDSVKKQPSWWDKNKGDIFKFCLTTTLSVLINSVIGIPLGHIVSSAISRKFV